MDVDHVLEHIGSLGRFQWISVVLFHLVTLGSVTLPNLVIVFTALEPSWKCVQNSTTCNLTGVYTLGDNLYDSRCSLERSEWEFVSDYSTIVTEWDLVCEKSIMLSTLFAIMFLGTLLGAIIFGSISDKYGRKKVLLVSNISLFLLSLVSSFVPSFWYFFVARFAIGVFVGGVVMNAYVFGLEFCGVRHRLFVAHLICGIPWTYSRGLLALAAYLIYSWRYLNIAMSLFVLPGIFSLWFFPESPHWLVVEGRVDEAKESLNKIARINRKTMPDCDLILAVEKPENCSNGNTFDLFRTWSATKFTLSIFCVWFSLSMQSYGIIFNAVNLGGNLYFNFGIIGVIILPSPLVAIFLTKRFGRKNCIAVSLLLSSIFCGIFVGVQHTETSAIVALRIGLFILISFLNEITWDSVYLISAEYFPTMTRTIGTGWCIGMARVGAFLSSYVLYLGRISTYLPLSVMGICTLFSAVLAALMRDTSNDATPETILEMDENQKRKYLYNNTLDVNTNIK